MLALRRTVTKGVSELRPLLSRRFGQESEDPCKKDDKKKPWEPKGKVVIVSGGASGIGKAAAKELVCAGAKVMICDLDGKNAKEVAESLNEGIGREVAIFCKCDVTDLNKYRETFKKTKDKFCKIDVVFNNAGIWNDSPDGWNREVDVNYKGVVNGCILGIEFMGAMCGGKGGTVVSTASILGLAPTCFMPIYSGTKSAVVQLTRCFAAKPHFEVNKIRYIAICPHETKTHLFDDMEKHYLFQSDEIKAEWGKLEAFAPAQKPESVGKALLTALREGENGSVWVTEFNHPAKLIHFEDVGMQGVDKTAKTPTISLKAKK